MSAPAPFVLQPGETLPEIKGVSNPEWLEAMWAEKAFKHAETYEKLLERLPSKKSFALTKIDDDIYKAFREEFPSLAVDNIKEAALKDAGEKEKWRAYLLKYEAAWKGQITDHTYGTLLRLNPTGELGPDNTTLVSRIQFLSIEIARLREGVYGP